MRRWQQYLRQVIQPQLDELAQLKAAAAVPAAPESTAAASGPRRKAANV